jgi:hypothetical protein
VCGGDGGGGGGGVVDTDPEGMAQVSVAVSLVGPENVGGYCTTGEVPWSPAVIGGMSRRKGAHLDRWTINDDPECAHLNDLMFVS